MEQGKQAPPSAHPGTTPKRRSPPVLDGGYGWIIVWIAFVCIFVPDGILVAFGGFIFSLNERFNVSPSVLAMAASVNNGVKSLSGIFVSGLMSKYGYKHIAMTGALTFCASMMICSMAKNFTTFLLAFGVVGGLGAGMLFLPPLVLISHFFKSKLALATTIARMGSPSGGFILAPLASLLIQLIGWHYAFFVLCCITFVVPIACVFLKTEPHKSDEAGLEDQLETIHHRNEAFIKSGQPKSALIAFPLQTIVGDALEDEPPVKPKSLFMLFPFQNMVMDIATEVGKEEEEKEKATASMATKRLMLVPLKSLDAGVEFARSLTSPLAERMNVNFEKGKNRISTLLDEKGIPVPEIPSDLKEVLSEPFLRGSNCLSSYLEQYDIQFNPELKDTMIHHFKNGRESVYSLIGDNWVRSPCNADSLDNPDEEGAQCGEGKPAEAASFTIGHRPLAHTFTNPLSQNSNQCSLDLAAGKRPTDSSRSRAQFLRSSSTVTQCNESRFGTKIEGVVYRNKPRARQLNSVHTKTTKDSLSPPVLANRSDPSRCSLRDIIQDIRKQSIHPPETKPTLLERLQQLVPGRLLKDPAFMSFCLANAIGNASSFIPFIYLHEFMIVQKFTAAQCSMVIAIIQVFNALGRVPLGWIVDMSWMNPTVVTMCLWSLSGVALLLWTFSTSLLAYLSVGILFGLGNTVLSIQSVVLMDLLSLSKLPKALGILLFCEGLAKIFVPPLAGCMATEYQDHNVIFYFSCAGFLLSVVFCLVSYLSKKYELHNKRIRSAVQV